MSYSCDFCSKKFRSKYAPFEFGGRIFCELCKKDIFEMLKKSFEK